MHNIYDCVESFIPLLDTEYHPVLGRKGIAVPLQISFNKKDCFHLMGLQYLIDRPELNRDRGRIFDEIKKRKITLKTKIFLFFYPKINLVNTFAVPFFPKVKKTTQKDRPPGLFYSSRKLRFLPVKRKFSIIT